MGGQRRERLVLPDAPSGVRFLPQLQFVLWSINLATGTSSYVRSVPPRGNGSVLHGGLPQHSSGRGEGLSLASPEWPPSCLLPDHAHIAPAAGTAGSWELTSESLFRNRLLPKNLISLLGAACSQNLVNIGDKVP